MPVLVNAKNCLDRKQCYAALGCPYDAYYHNALRHTWEVDATRCGDCPAPCMNFCDANAVLWADNLFELDLLKSQLAGTLTVDEVAERRTAQRAKDAAAAQAAQAAQQKAAGGITVITAQNFQAEVVGAALPVVMDCWAAWCGPCKTFAPIFEKTAREYAGMVKFVKLDTDAEPALAQALGIKALPTTLFFYQGQVVHGLQGAVPTVQAFSGVVYQVLAALRQRDPTLGTAPATDTPADAPAPAASGLITGPDPGPPPAAPPAAPPPSRRAKPRLYLP